VIKNQFTYQEVKELLEKLNGSDVKDVKKWLDKQLDDGLTKEEKISFICQNESKILFLIVRIMTVWGIMGDSQNQKIKKQ